MLKIRFTDQRQGPVWVVDKSFAIGSASDNDLVIDAPSVSPQHARVLWINGVYTLHDLTGQNGTYVNDQRVKQRALQDGDKVRVGEVDLEIVDPAVPGNQPQWTLIASSSWLAGQEFPLVSRTQGREVKVGRSNHCDLIFPGTHLSREHVLLTLSDREVQVRDLGSANGTFINDVRVAEGTLYSGDQIRLDVYSFRVYGPGQRYVATPSAPPSEQTTNLRVAAEAIDAADPETGAQPKRWKTRPTSPGNRSETPAGSGPYNAAIKALALFLGIALITLAVYLLFG